MHYSGHHDWAFQQDSREEQALSKVVKTPELIP